MAGPRVAPDPFGMDHPDTDLRIQEIAAQQHGVVSRRQLLGAGISLNAIAHRLKKGTLRGVHRGVYRIGPLTGRFQWEMAAVLACGPEAALSHRTAGGISGILLPRQPEAPIDVIGPQSRRGPANGVRLHRMEPLEPDEVTRRHGLPLTSPARTILDLASCLGPYELERALARALKKEVVNLDSLETMLLRHPYREGHPKLRDLLDTADPAFTRSEAEARFLALLRKGDVPRPRANAVVNGLEVDFFWPDRGVVAEVDGFAYHSRRSAFEQDRQRDGILAAEDLSVLRFTWRQIQREPERVLVRLCMALGARKGWKPERGGGGQP